MNHSDAARPSLSPSDRLAELWEGNPRTPPDLREFLRQCGKLSARDLADVLLIDQQFRWQAGDGTPVETYLAEWPEIAADSELRFDFVYGEYRARSAHG